MKKVKRLLAGLLAVVMLSTTFASVAFAADGAAKKKSPVVIVISDIIKTRREARRSYLKERVEEEIPNILNKGMYLIDDFRELRQDRENLRKVIRENLNDHAQDFRENVIEYKEGIREIRKDKKDIREDLKGRGLTGSKIDEEALKKDYLELISNNRSAIERICEILHSESIDSLEKKNPITGIVFLQTNSLMIMITGHENAVPGLRKLVDDLSDLSKKYYIKEDES